MHHLVVGEVVTTPADDLALLKPRSIRSRLPIARARSRCLRGERPVCDGQAGNAKIAGDASAAIAAAYGKAHAVTVAEMKGDEQSKWGYTDFGAPGEVAKREHIADLDVDLVTFKNGVRLNLKKTDFEAGRIVLSALGRQRRYHRAAWSARPGAARRQHLQCGRSRQAQRG